MKEPAGGSRICSNAISNQKVDQFDVDITMALADCSDQVIHNFAERMRNGVCILLHQWLQL